MSGPKGINWELALEFYLTPDSEGKIPSYQDVAEKFGVSKSEVGLRAKQESWLQRRRNLYDSTEETFIQNRIELIKYVVGKHIAWWRKIQDIASDLLERLNKDLSENGFKPSLIKDLTLLTGILRTAIEGERTALGLPNVVNPISAQKIKEEVTLSPEIIQEIDRLFELNSRKPAFVN